MAGWPINPPSQAAAPVDEVTAIEVEQRVGAGYVVVPAIGRVGGRFIVTARLLAVAAGRASNDGSALNEFPVVATVSTEVARDADVLGALDGLVRRLRRALGESYLASRRGVPLPVATTSSLPALKAYADGQRARASEHNKDAEESWRLALAYDSTFALAHASLGGYLTWMNRSGEAEPHLAAATRFSVHLPPRERLIVEARIATWRGDHRLAVALRQGWVADYPGDQEILGGLAYEYLRGKQYALARDAFTELLQVDSLDAVAHLDLATALAELRTPADLRRANVEFVRAFALDTALAGGVTYLHEYAAALALTGRADSARAVFCGMLARDPSVRARGYRGLAFLDLMQGHPADAASNFREALKIYRVVNDDPLSELSRRRRSGRRFGPNRGSGA
ncbi:MAG: hypothetical protein ABIT20_11240 [Gemmatimonadaceae bacterium]